MNGINRVVLLGTLGSDGEVRKAGENTLFTIRVAVNERYKAKDGTWKETTTWVKCQKWSGVPGWQAQLAVKGAHVAVEGRLTGNSWIDKQGNKRRETLVTIETLSFPGARRGGEQRFQDGSGSIEEPAGGSSDDELPF